jgi:serine/threonine-protein kinase HipA
VVARNQDDHVKNIAFLMDKSGTWSLSPAYDLTYSYNPDGRWTSKHQMTLAGKRDEFTLADFDACAAALSFKRGCARAIIDEVHDAVSAWPSFASEAGVPDSTAARITRGQRLELAAR